MIKLYQYGDYKMIKRIFKYTKILIMLITISLGVQVSIPNNETKTTNTNLNKTIDLNTMAIKIEEIKKKDLYTPIDTYNGDITGYAADCPLCTGFLGCNGQNVLDRTTTYNDKDYGTVRIVASSLRIPCGTIVEFSLNTEPNNKITAIVLDRGVTGTSLDLLVESEDYAINYVGRQNVTYNILRYGYEREV